MKAPTHAEFDHDKEYCMYCDEGPSGRREPPLEADRLARALYACGWPKNQDIDMDDVVARYAALGEPER